MIDTFVKRWEKNKHLTRAAFTEDHPRTYLDVVMIATSALIDGNARDHKIYPAGAQELTFGDYSGNAVFVIPSEEWYPDHFWSVIVHYGSCSGCDTLQRIRDCEDKAPTEAQVDDYMTLALHIVQNLKSMGKEEDHDEC